MKRFIVIVSSLVGLAGLGLAAAQGSSARGVQSSCGGCECCPCDEGCPPGCCESSTCGQCSEQGACCSGGGACCAG